MDVHVHTSLCRAIVAQVVTQQNDHTFLGGTAAQDPRTARPARLGAGESPANQLATAVGHPDSSEAPCCLPASGKGTGAGWGVALLARPSVLAACSSRAHCVPVACLFS